MKKVYFTPGPSQLYPTVNSHIRTAVEENICSISHRSDYFMSIVKDCKKELRNLMDIPTGHKIYFLSSATECMERIIESCAHKKTCHFVNGAFSELFYKTAINLIDGAEKIEVKEGYGFSSNDYELSDDYEIVCFTHNETSTGVMLDLKDLSKSIKKKKNTLFALDVVSSVPYVQIDFTLFDLVFFSVQKGMGLPAGLGVLIVSPKAFKKAESIHKTGYGLKSYHDLINLDKYLLKNQTPETPNVFAIYLTGKVIHDMNTKGITNIRKETEEKADKLYEYIKDSKKLSIAVKKEIYRSRTVIVANTFFNVSEFTKHLESSGFVIGKGYKDKMDKQIRIANFPATSLGDVEKLINTMKVAEKSYNNKDN